MLAAGAVGLLAVAVAVTTMILSNSSAGSDIDTADEPPARRRVEFSSPRGEDVSGAEAAGSTGDPSDGDTRDQPNAPGDGDQSREDAAGRDRADDRSTSAAEGARLFTDREDVYGRYVAVLWSGFTSGASAPTDETLAGQLDLFRARFGSSVVAVDSNDFRSLRNGTVAVVNDGGFTSARDAKVWCRANGFPGVQDCFGVVLSDDATPEDRGEFVRVYDL